MRILFHVPYPLNRLATGSSVHPFRMREAFLAAGFDVFTISGTTRERRKQIIQLSRSQLDRIAFCYSSPSSYPVHPVWDYLLYKKVNERRIPTGIFYCDAYWLLAPEWIRQPPLRRWLLVQRYRLDLLIFGHFARVVFFPSSSFAEYFDAQQRKAILYPGAMNLDRAILNAEHARAKSNIVIYVGSITPRYGLDILLEALELANREIRVVLELVCP